MNEHVCEYYIWKAYQEFKMENAFLQESFIQEAKKERFSFIKQDNATLH